MKATNKNSIHRIRPWREPAGMWLFTDLAHGLVNEPFIGETNALIDWLVLQACQQDTDRFDEASAGFTLVFSANPFPGHLLHCRLVDTNINNGSTYLCEQLGIEGWLCPALFHYFPEAPPHLYAVALLDEQPQPNIEDTHEPIHTLGQ